MRRSLSEIEAFLYRRADELRANPTPEERALAAMLGHKWHWQYPMILLGVRGKVHGVIFDAFYPRAKLAIELDGKHHKKGPDSRRDRAAIYNGILTLRYPNARIRKGIDVVYQEIQQVLKERING